AARRTHGTDAADKFARASYIGGFGGTSNVRASARYGIPGVGTMAHSFITSFETDLDAFRAYANVFPDSSTLLVDTYDTAKGVEAAITVARELENGGHKLVGIRLDSGDLDALSRTARRMLDHAGLPYVQIVASGGLDEFSIERLSLAGAPVDAYGVGTLAGVSADAPWSDAAYKQVMYDGRPVAKFSPSKRTYPRAKQVWRSFDPDGRLTRDHLTAASAEAPDAGALPLLADVMRNGSPIAAAPSLDDVRERVRSELARLPDSALRLSGPTPCTVTISREL
ncbi:MAG: nicotinate phosphoribosyltransferase, partial [Chloroflexi bacterium]|nr:nicotinate phosphoribosyltransferase [Chloroflexota bacterium]